MKLFPAIDLYEGKAVRLAKGDFNRMTVYSNDPPAFAAQFKAKGAQFLHVVDLEGAKSGGTPNAELIKKIVAETDLKVEIGGGIRSEEVIEKYLELGVMRVILGTAAVENPNFLEKMLRKYGEKIAVGVDLNGSKVAIKGWLETSELDCYDFFEHLEAIGVKTVICTDISKDGMLGGTNVELYKALSSRYKLDLVASGGVSTLDDIRRLKALGLYGAILGRAIYTGDVDLEQALKVARGEELG